MKKILLVFDGEHFSKASFEFVKQMNQKEPVMAVGVFLPGIDYSELLYSLGGLTGPMYVSAPAVNEPEVMHRAIKHFESLCQHNGIRYRIHAQPEKHTIPQLKEETKFADLLVLSSELFYANLDIELQEDYIENVLHKAECPVLLMPESYYEPETIIFAYDGSDASLYAAKQFMYLLPQYQQLKAALIYTGSKAIPERSHIEELIGCHYEHFNMLRLHIKNGEKFEEWVLTHKNPLLVTGAYGRSLFSELLKESFIKAAIRDHKLPIFVTHK